MFHRHQRCKKHNKKLYDVTNKSIFQFFSFELFLVNSNRQIIECVTFIMFCNQYFFDVFILVRSFQSTRRL